MKSKTTKYYTRWPAQDEEHVKQQCENGSVMIQRRGHSDWAEYMNGDFMGITNDGPPEGALEISRDNFNRWAPACLK